MTDDHDPTVARVLADERALLRGLTRWALVSVAAGGVQQVLDRRRSGRPLPDADGAGPVLTGFAAGLGRQGVGWGAVDLAIALWGRRGLRRAEREAAAGVLDAGAARARARRLGRVTAVNAALDVGYVAAGLALAARSPRWRGDGLGAAVQGLALLVLDVRHTRAARRAARA